MITTRDEYEQAKTEFIYYNDLIKNGLDDLEDYIIANSLRREIKKYEEKLKVK